MNRPTSIIEPSRGWNKIDLKELWSFRSLIWILIVRDVKTRYKQQALGPLWLLISPFVSMVIMSFVFGSLAGLPSDGLPYPLFLFTASLAWSFFTSVYSGALVSLRNFMGWISKLYIPRLAAPIISIATGLVDWAIQIIILFLLLLYYQVIPSLSLLMLPFYMLIAIIVGLAVGLWASALSVRFRDLPNLISYGITAWYYVTPVLYSASLVPQEWQWFYKLNPMYWVVEGFRWSLLAKGQKPEPLMFLSIGLFSVFMIFSIYIFIRTSRNIVDIQ